MIWDKKIVDELKEHAEKIKQTIRRHPELRQDLTSLEAKIIDTVMNADQGKQDIR